MDLQETNAVETTEEVSLDNLPDELETPASEATEPESLPTEESPTQEETPTFLSIKHLGQEKALTQDEAVTLAQKGMDYDHVKEKLASMQSDPVFAVMDKYAAIAGMNRAEYVQFLEQRQKEFEIQQKVTEGMDEHHAKEFVEAKREAGELRALKEIQEQARQREAEAQSVREKQLRAFIVKYPDVKEFPPDVLADISAGLSPIEAYAIHENKQLLQQMEVSKTNNKNKESKVGSADGTGSQDDVDLFVQGFLDK